MIQTGVSDSDHFVQLQPVGTWDKNTHHAV